MNKKAIITCLLTLCTAVGYADDKSLSWTEKTARKLLRDITEEAQQLRQNNSLILKQKLDALAQAETSTRNIANCRQEQRQETDRIRQAQQRQADLEHRLKQNQLTEQNIRALAGNDLTFFLTAQLRQTASTVSENITETKAIAPDGTLLSGRQATFGPFAYFQENAEQPRCALLTKHPNQPYPNLFTQLTPQQQAEIERLFKGDLATPPLDPSGGKALAVIHHTDTWLQHLKKGGIIMLPLAILAAIATMTILLKAGQFLKLDRKLDALKRLAKDYPRLDSETLEEKLYLAAGRQNASLERFLATIAVCASAAPLLGLLGTVTGMIHTFSLITIYGTGDPRLLSTGISEALITTEAGLAIAIPALLAHAWLSRKLKRFQARQKQTAIDLVAGRKQP